MADPADPISGLPDVIRQSNRPIIIYQGGPPPYVDTRTGNALGLLAWLALITVCLAVAGFEAWGMWNPGYDPHRFSPIYAQGHPRGLNMQLEERRQINAWADGLGQFRDQLRANNDARRIVPLTHPLITDNQGIDLDHQGVDALRQQWDAMCANIRARIYDRRLSTIDNRVEQLRRERAYADLADQQHIDDELQSLRQQRADEVERRRTDSDPSLRCIPAAQADLCSDSNDDAWCNPQLRHPDEFVDD